MTKVVAMTGKGGAGKTPISALLSKYLLEKEQTFFLVDADSNVNLNERLGLDVSLTLNPMILGVTAQPTCKMKR